MDSSEIWSLLFESAFIALGGYFAGAVCVAALVLWFAPRKALFNSKASRIMLFKALGLFNYPIALGLIFVIASEVGYLIDVPLTIAQASIIMGIIFPWLAWFESDMDELITLHRNS